MKHLLEFQLEDGTPITVEVEDTGPDGSVRRIGRTADLIEKSEQSFTEVINRVRPAAEAVLSAFQSLEQPEEIKIEFGIKFNAKAGVIIASVDSEATFKVALKWSNST